MTEEAEGALAALLAAHPPTASWPLIDLLRLGCAPGAEAATLARLAAHPEEAARKDDPPTADGLTGWALESFHRPAMVFRRKCAAQSGDRTL